MQPGSTVFQGVADIIAVLVLLVEFLMLRSALLRSQVRLYAAQSLLIAALAASIAVARDVPGLWALAGVSLAFKVVAVPLVVLRLMRGTGTEIAGSGAFGVASQVLLALVAAGFGFFALGSLDIAAQVLPRTALSIAFAVVLVSFVLIATRSDVVSQAVGFFSLENGVSLASLVVAAGLPLILEVAFLFDLLVAVVVFGVLMRVHHRRTASLSTAELTRLRG